MYPILTFDWIFDTMRKHEGRHMKEGIKSLATLAVIILVVVLLDVGCIFERVIGIPCMGCGLTRACLAALSLDFESAFYYNPMFLVTLSLLAVCTFKGSDIFKEKRKNTIFWIVITSTYLLVYAYRMILYFPHTQPMTFNEQAIVPQVVQFFMNLIT